MEDITPKLLEAIQNDFQSQFDKSKTIQSLYAKIRDGTATYDEANDFAIETGRLLSASFQRNLSEDVLPDGRMYYNIANRILNSTLINNHKLITEVTSEVQTSLNKAAGLGLKAIVPDVNESRITGLVNKVSSATEFSTVAWLFDEPVINFSQSIVDDAIRANAEFQYKSGLSPKIVRREVGNCCDWCKEVVGSYEYPDVPEGVYKRHRYCRCTVAYEAGKYATDVHTKREYDSGDVKARIENSRAFQERLGVESQRQKAERKRQAKLQAWKEETLKKQQKASRIEYAKNGGKTAKALENTGESGKIKREIFLTTDDPMREVTGAGLLSHPNEINVILEDMESAGVIIERRANAMGYQPNPTAGSAGKFIIDDEASYSAWMHEYTHFLDDREDGYIGLRVFKDLEKCRYREVHAYDVEIELAKEAGRLDIVKRLTELKRKGVAKYEPNTDID